MTTQETADIIVKIMKINRELSDEKFLKSLSGDVLSYIGVKLSALKASLLDEKVSAHRDAMNKETLMQKAKGEAFLRAKIEHTTPRLQGTLNILMSYSYRLRTITQKLKSITRN